MPISYVFTLQLYMYTDLSCFSVTGIHFVDWFTISEVNKRIWCLKYMWMCVYLLIYLDSVMYFLLGVVCGIIMTCSISMTLPLFIYAASYVLLLIFMDVHYLRTQRRINEHSLYFFSLLNLAKFLCFHYTVVHVYWSIMFLSDRYPFSWSIYHFRGK